MVFYSFLILQIIAVLDVFLIFKPFSPFRFFRSNRKAVFILKYYKTDVYVFYYFPLKKVINKISLKLRKTMTSKFMVFHD